MFIVNWWNLDHLVTVPGTCLLAHLLCIKIRNSNTFNLRSSRNFLESNPNKKNDTNGGPGIYIYIIYIYMKVGCRPRMILNLCSAGYVILSVKLSCPCEFFTSKQARKQSCKFSAVFSCVLPVVFWHMDWNCKEHMAGTRFPWPLWAWWQRIKWDDSTTYS